MNLGLLEENNKNQNPDVTVILFVLTAASTSSSTAVKPSEPLGEIVPEARRRS
jgi:hypothetical protein